MQSASPKRVPLGKTPTVTARGTLGNWANDACVRRSLRGKARLLPRAASTVRSAILRRRTTGSSSRARPVAHHANCRRAVPLRSLLTHAPLARPSIRRVFLRSICARRCSIGSLNRVRGKTAASTQSTNWESTTLAPALRLGLRPRWICHLGGVQNSPLYPERFCGIIP